MAFKEDFVVITSYVNCCPEKYLRGGELGFSKNNNFNSFKKTFKFVILVCGDCNRIDKNKITQPQGIREIYRGSTLKSLILSLKT